MALPENAKQEIEQRARRILQVTFMEDGWTLSEEQADFVEMGMMAGITATAEYLSDLLDPRD